MKELISCIVLFSCELLNLSAQIKSSVLKDNEIVGDFMEAIIHTDKKRISFGDSVKCQIRLYTNMYVISVVWKTEGINKAILHELKLPDVIKPEQVYYKGDSVNRVLCREFYIIPTLVGHFCLKGLSCIVEYGEVDKSVDQVEASFNGGAYIQRKKNISVPPLYLEVVQDRIGR